MRVGPPAIGGHDRGRVGQQLAGVILVAVGADAQHGVAVGERAPQRASLAGGAPAGLVHVQRVGGTNTLEQIGVRVHERAGDALEDRVDRARADASAEQLLAQLDDIAARDAVAHRQHRHRRMKARPERAGRDVGGQLGAPALAATRAAHARAPVLGHRHRQPRQLLDLMAHRLADRDQLALGEDVPALTPGRPMHDHLVDRRGRQTARGPCPHDRAGRPACAPTGPCRAAAASPADRRSAAATSCARTASPDARAARSARPASRRAAPGAGSARPSATAPQRPLPGPGHRSPRPRPAPHHQIRRARRYVPQTN